MMISEFVDGMHINGQFIVGSVSKGVNASGAPYLNIELKDSTGSIPAKKWDCSSEDETLYAVGNIVCIEGDVLKYKETLQIRISNAKAVSLDEVDVTKFVKAPPVPKEELMKRFDEYVSSIGNKDCKKLLDYFIEKFSPKLFDFPAGVSVHHEYGSGLLMHVTTMAKIADILCPIYDCDRDIVLTGVLIHDMGKTIELEGPAVFHYSLEGKLLGHISIMVSEIRKAAEELHINSDTPLLLEHMVLSHHGQPEFGSPVPPLTKEAMLLNMIDNLDSKMVIANKALEVTIEGEFSQRIYPLDGRCLYKPKK